MDPYSFFTDPDPDPEFAVGDQYGSGKKIKFFFDQKLQFTSKHEFFLLLWVIFALLDPDPYSNYGSGSGSNGSTTLLCIVFLPHASEHKVYI